MVYRSDAEARGYESFEPTLVKVMRLDHPPDAQPLDDIDLVTPTPAAFAEAVGELQQTSAEQRAAYLERLIQSPQKARTVMAL